MNKSINLFLLLLFPYLLLAYSQEVDASKADVDGPYVFFRNGQVQVKSVIEKDGNVQAIQNDFELNTEVTLTCTVKSTGDQFSFPLFRKYTVPSDTYAEQKKVAVLSDIEGNFKGMKMWLIKAGVMSDDFRWTYGKGHLVLVGDFFDRGLQVTECLWLLYKLDMEAQDAGGRVHFILGNHEVMNMLGDVQSVRKKYLENAALLGENYRDLYGPESELGLWLRSKNTMEVIGDVLFVHGGLSPDLVEKKVTVQQINEEMRERLSLPAEFTPRGPKSGFAVEDREHPIWSREMAKAKLTEEEVDNLLTHFGVKHVVLGHTVMQDITLLHGGKVIIVDQHHAENVRRGFMVSMVIANGRFFRLHTKEGSKML